MSLRPYQQIASDFILERDRCALWADMGLGKTLATLPGVGPGTDPRAQARGADHMAR